MTTSASESRPCTRWTCGTLEVEGTTAPIAPEGARLGRCQGCRRPLAWSARADTRWSDARCPCCHGAIARTTRLAAGPWLVLTACEMDALVANLQASR